MNEENYLKDKFIEMSKIYGFTILKRSGTTSPDLIIELMDKKIGIELKSDLLTTTVSKGIGQLLFGKAVLNLDELWLIFPKRHARQQIDINWFKTMEYVGIKPYFLEETNLIPITEEDCNLFSRTRWLQSQILSENKPTKQEEQQF